METLVKRIVACLIDMLIVYLLSMIIQPLLNTFFVGFTFLPDFIYKWLLENSASFVIFIIYTGFGEGIFYKTVGKVVMKVHIENEDGSDVVSLGSTFLRALIKASSIYMLYGIVAAVDIIYMINNPESSFHDKLAGTSVCENIVG